MAGEILSEKNKLALQEVCERCGLPETTVRAYVEEGAIEVEGDRVARWRFSEVTVVRVLKAHRLERDLGLNPAGAALALDLIEQIDELKSQLKRLEKYVP
ncbi:MAG: chaperone modulator CbpM [Hyphomicrobiales bacterium]|nr:chaperone modulator CbpM [Hyphomicrobiales bacterium]